MTIHISRKPLAAGVLFALLTTHVVACSSATTPRPNGATATHPEGTTSSRIPGIVGRPFGVRVSATGVLAVTQQDANAVTLTDLSGKSPLSILVGADPGEVVFNAAGTRAYVSAYNAGTIDVIDVAAARTTRTPLAPGNAYRLALSPDETKLFVSTVNGRLYAMTLATSTATSVAIPGALQGLAVDRAGKFLYVGATSGTVFKLDAASLAVVGSTSVGGKVQDIALSPDGSELFVANEAGWVDVLDATTFALRRHVVLTGGAFGLAVTPDGAQLYITLPDVGGVAVVDVASHTVLRTIFVGGLPRRVAFDRYGTAAAVANEGDYVTVIR